MPSIKRPASSEASVQHLPAFRRPAKQASSEAGVQHLPAVGDGPPWKKVDREPGPLRVWTDCSGMECPLWALRNLGVKFHQLQTCDNAKPAQAFWQAHFADERTVVNDDICQHDDDLLLSVETDLYVCGFPCPDFSQAGKGQGVNGPTGHIIVHVVHRIQKLLPSVFILENVCGLMTQHPKTLQWLIKTLQNMCNQIYHVTAKVMNSQDHGLPQNRPRLYILGIVKDRMVNGFEFQWPEKVGHAPLQLILDSVPDASPGSKLPKPKVTMPPESQKTARKNFTHAFKNIASDLKINPLTSDIVCDIDGGQGPHFMDGIVPCLTRSRCGKESHWVFCRGRRLNLAEMLRLTGVRPADINLSATSHTQLGKMIGNSMSVPVLERLLLRLLPAVGLMSAEKAPKRWESMEQVVGSAAELSSKK